MEQQIDQFLIILVSLIISLLSLHLFRKWLMIKPAGCSKRRLPPSPPKLPILGNLHQLTALTHRSFQSLGRTYGPVMLLHFGGRPVIIVQSADAAMEIMKTHDLTFANKPSSSTTRRLMYDLKDITVAPYGEYWRKLKSLCVLQLLSSKKVQSFQFIREEETALLMEEINNNTVSETCLGVNLSEMFVSLSNDVVCRSTFGKKYSSGDDGKKFLMLLTELMQLLGSLSVGEFIPRLWWINRVNGFDARVDKVSKQVDDFLDQVIEEHMNIAAVESMGNDDVVKVQNFVRILLDIYKDNTTGVPIDRDNVKGIILNLILGGTDTASATLEWSMTELLRHPTVMKKLQSEVREILRDKQDITHNDLEKMQYLKAVVRETLRYHTPIPFLAREAREDVNVMGYEIEAGTMIITNAWAIGRDPASWDDPEKFQPERFLNSSPVDFMGLDFEFIPFGAGRRRCPGIGFAMASVELVLANLMQKFEWELPKGMKSEDLDTIEQPGVTIHRKNPLFAVPTHCFF